MREARIAANGREDQEEHVRQGPRETGEEENRITANGAEPEEMAVEYHNGRVDEMEEVGPYNVEDK